MAKILLIALFILGLMIPANAGAVIIEGFESGNLSLYTASSGIYSFAVTNAAAHDGTYGLSANGGIDSAWIYRNDSAALTQQGDVLSVWVRRTNTVHDGGQGSGGRAYAGFGATATGTYSAVIAPNTSQLIIQKNTGYDDFIDLNVVSQTYLPDHWYKLGINWGLGGLIVLQLFDSDGTTLLKSVSATDNTFTSGGIAFRSFAGDSFFDTYERAGVVPLPGSLLLLGSGLFGLAGLRRIFGKP